MKRVSIDDLISPLRYDVLVRQRYFSTLTANRELLEGDLAPLFELSRATEYFAWFRSIVVPRFMPHLMDREAEIEAAFERRVRATVELLRSFEHSGLDPNRPVTIRTGRSIQATSTGKRLARRLYTGDGCHRLAWLRAQGVAALEPGAYRVAETRKLTPLDNTSILLRVLPIDPREYWGFLALSYGDLVAADRSGPAADAAVREPRRLQEMMDVASLDLPLLRAAS